MTMSLFIIVATILLSALFMGSMGFYIYNLTSKIKSRNHRRCLPNKGIIDYSRKLFITPKHVLNSLDNEFFFEIKRYILIDYHFSKKMDKTKKSIASDMLRSKLYIWHKNYVKLLKKVNKNNEFNYKICQNYIDKTVNEYTNVWKNELEIPQSILSRFHTEHEKKMTIFKNKLEKLFKNNLDKNTSFFVDEFLKMSLELLVDTVNDMERIMDTTIITEKYTKSYLPPSLKDFFLKNIRAL